MSAPSAMTYAAPPPMATYAAAPMTYAAAPASYPHFPSGHSMIATEPIQEVAAPATYASPVSGPNAEKEATKKRVTKNKKKKGGCC